MWGKLRVLAALAACLALASVVAATAEAKPPITFVSSEAIATSCAELTEKGVRIPLRNETATKREVRVRLILIRPGGQQVRAKGVCGGLRRSPKMPVVLKPGGGRAIILHARNATAKGTFEGSIAVFTHGSRVARRDFTISAEPAAPPALAIAPGVSSFSASIHTGDKGPFWIPVKGSNSELPAAAKGSAGDEPVTVGALTGPSGPVAVTYDGETKALAGASQVGLNLEGDLSPGTYSGQVDLSPADEAGGITFELKVSRSIWWAILMIVAGIVVGLVLLSFSGRRVPAARLRARVAELSNRYDQARAVLQLGKGAKSWRDFEIGDLNELQQELYKQIEDARHKATIKIDSKSIENIETAIAGVEAKVDLLKVMPRHAQEVEKALQLPKATSLPPLDDDQADARPALEQKLTKLIEGRELGADELKPEMDAMDAGATQIRQLRAQEATLERVWGAKEALNADQDPKVRKVDETLRECRRQLWAAGDAAGLTEATGEIAAARKEFIEVQGEIKQREIEQPESTSRPIYVDINSIADMVTGQRPFTSEGLGGPAHPTKDAGTATPVPAAVAPTESTSTPPPSPTPPAPPLDRDDEATKSAVRWALIVQRIVIVFAAAVAVVAGLELLYTGKTWGTTWDFIAAFLWGVAAQTTVTSLGNSLDEFSSLRWFRRR
jgi:hypothetical protein